MLFRSSETVPALFVVNTMFVPARSCDEMLIRRFVYAYVGAEILTVVSEKLSFVPLVGTEILNAAFIGLDGSDTV